MGKKSLTKSTGETKKNAASKKKQTTKTTAEAAAEKNTKAKNTETKNTSGKPSLKSIRKRKFESWSPGNPYTPPQGPKAEEKFTAPDLTGDYDPADAEKIRNLLFRQIDLSTAEPDTSATLAESKEEKHEKTAEQQPDDDIGSGGGGGKSGEPPGPPGGGGWQMPISRGMIGLIAALILIFALLIGASLNNMGNYYLKQTNAGLEIWRGDFSPSGMEKIVTLHGIEASKPLKDEYSRQEALAPAFQYFMEKADEAAEKRDLPNLNTVRDNLEKAKKYAVTEKQKKQVKKRLSSIDFLMLLYRADVAAEKQTKQGYETALDIYKQAEKLELTEDDSQALKQRISRTQKELEKLKQKSENPENKDDSE